MTIKKEAGITVLIADQGKHFENTEGVNCGIEMWLGREDSADSYTEVDIIEQ